MEIEGVDVVHLREIGGLFEGLAQLGHAEMRFAVGAEAVLSRSLKQLERDGLISRQVFGSRPPLKTEYALTPFGASFLPVLAALTEWGNRAVVELGSFIGETE